MSSLFADRCVDGITANTERLRELAESSPSVATPLNRFIGYDEAAKVAKQALAEGKTIRDVVLERGYVEQGKISRERLDEVLDLLAMTRPDEPR
jgi:fumarate hydratase class II